MGSVGYFAMGIFLLVVAGLCLLELWFRERKIRSGNRGDDQSVQKPIRSDYAMILLAVIVALSALYAGIG